MHPGPRGTKRASRRRVLAAVAGATAGSSGCLGVLGNDANEGSTQSEDAETKRESTDTGGEPEDVDAYPPAENYRLFASEVVEAVPDRGDDVLQETAHFASNGYISEVILELDENSTPHLTSAVIAVELGLQARKVQQVSPSDPGQNYPGPLLPQRFHFAYSSSDGKTQLGWVVDPRTGAEYLDMDVGRDAYAAQTTGDYTHVGTAVEARPYPPGETIRAGELQQAIRRYTTFFNGLVDSNNFMESWDFTVDSGTLHINTIHPEPETDQLLEAIGEVAFSYATYLDTTPERLHPETIEVYFTSEVRRVAQSDAVLILDTGPVYDFIGGEIDDTTFFNRVIENTILVHGNGTVGEMFR